MEILKKNYVRIIAVMLAVVITVSTPISDFADTQGIGQTDAAAATTLITVAKLFGAIAGAYGIYVAADNLADWADEWVTWTSTRNSEAYKDLQAITQGVATYVMTKSLIKSVADFLKTKTAPSAYYTVNGEYYGALDSDFTLDYESPYIDSFFDDVVYGVSSDVRIPVYVQWTPHSTYSSGLYTFYYIQCSSDFWKQNWVNNEEAYDYCVHIPTVNNAGKLAFSENICISIFDEAGLPIAFRRCENISDYTLIRMGYHYDGSLGWVASSKDVKYNIHDVSTFETGYYAFINPVYVTSLDRNDTGASAFDIVDNTIRVKSVNVDYSVHGNNALDNTDALTGAEVTEEKLVNLHDVSTEAYESWLKSQQSNGDNNEESDSNLNLALNTALASAIASAVVKELKDMGYIETPTDTPSEGVDDAVLGDIQISVNGVVDAVNQLGTKLQGIAEGVANISSVIAESIRSVFEELFVPDTEAIQERVAEATNKFSSFNSLATVVDDIEDSITNASGPPVIYIHFEDADDSRYTPVGTIKMLSFEWYEPYKPYGDALLSSMMWLFFLWSLRRRFSEIIQGVSSLPRSDSKGGSVNDS